MSGAGARLTLAEKETTMTPDSHAGRIAPAILVALALFTATPAAAQAPDVTSIVARMKQAVEPAASSLRKLTLTVAQGGTTSQVSLGQARGKVAGGNRVLTVVLAPADLRGVAFLLQEMPANDNDQLWTYVPAIGRVRNVVGPEAFSAFLNSDFTYSDLGFRTLRSTYALKGEETTNGARTYRVEETPVQRWYYARTVTLVAADSFLPVERDFFDPANQPWKVEHFDKVTAVGGVPTPLSTTIDDTQSKSRSSLVVTDLRYGADVPSALLQPEGMPQAAASPVWTSLQAPVGK
jgi:hypothetical protein